MMVHDKPKCIVCLFRSGCSNGVNYHNLIPMQKNYYNDFFFANFSAEVNYYLTFTLLLNHHCKKILLVQLKKVSNLVVFKF